MNYSMKEVCTKFNLTAHTLRYYEKIGLLKDIERTSGGIRSYTDENLETLGLICCLKNTGMPLAEITEFINLTREGDHTLGKRCDLLKHHQAYVEERMAEMQMYIEKITCKINCYSEMLENYEKTLQ